LHNFAGDRTCRLTLGRLRAADYIGRLDRREHDPEKWVPIFRKDHAPPKIYSAMTTIRNKAIAL
jgi:hypothetical protein